MKFSSLGKAIKELQSIGLDDLDIMIMHQVNVGQYTTVGEIITGCANRASPATVHGRITKKLVDAKLLKLKLSPADKRVKYVELGSQFWNLADKLVRI